MPKSYDKSCHNKSRKQLTNEGVVSFLRLSLKRRKGIKYVIGKRRKHLTKKGTIYFWRLRKVVIGKASKF